jgi:hypothetical protein
LLATSELTARKPRGYDEDQGGIVEQGEAIKSAKGYFGHDTAEARAVEVVRECRESEKGYGGLTSEGIEHLIWIRCRTAGGQ